MTTDAATFYVSPVVLDEWENWGDKFRLVDQGAGPDELQIMQDGAWRPEKPCYVHAILTQRIRALAEKVNT